MHVVCFDFLCRSRVERSQAKIQLHPTNREDESQFQLISEYVSTYDDSALEKTVKTLSAELKFARSYSIAGSIKHDYCGRSGHSKDRYFSALQI